MYQEAISSTCGRTPLDHAHNPISPTDVRNIAAVNDNQQRAISPQPMLGDGASNQDGLKQQKAEQGIARPTQDCLSERGTRPLHGSKHDGRDEVESNYI